MRSFLLLFCLLPLISLGSAKDTGRHQHTLQQRMIAYATLGYVNEQWHLGNTNTTYHSDMQYTGEGSVMGGGFMSKFATGKKVGMGMSFLLFNYNQKSIPELQDLNGKLTYLRITPTCYVRLPMHNGWNMHVGANVALNAPLKSNNEAYLQPGFCTGLDFGAFGAYLNYSLASRSAAPFKNLPYNHWSSQNTILQVVFYPSRMEGWHDMIKKWKESAPKP